MVTGGHSQEVSLMSLELSILETNLTTLYMLLSLLIFLHGGLLYWLLTGDLKLIHGLVGLLSPLMVEYIFIKNILTIRKQLKLGRQKLRLLAKKNFGMVKYGV